MTRDNSLRIPMKMMVNIHALAMIGMVNIDGESHEGEIHFNGLEMICNPRMGSKSKVKNRVRIFVKNSLAYSLSFSWDSLGQEQ